MGNRLSLFLLGVVLSWAIPGDKDIAHWQWQVRPSEAWTTEAVIPVSAVVQENGKLHYTSMRSVRYANLRNRLRAIDYAGNRSEWVYPRTCMAPIYYLLGL